MPDEFDSPSESIFDDTGSDVADSDSFDTTMDSSADDLSGIMTESVDTSMPTLDGDFYHATPISKIPILQEDGSAASLEEIMAENAESDSGSLDEVEPYTAAPNSDLPILQEDGEADSLESIMAANADIDEPALDSPVVESPQPDSADEGAINSLEAIMNNSSEFDSDRLEGSDLGISPVADSLGSLEGDITLANEGIDVEGAAVDTGSVVDPDAEPIRMAQSDVEAYIANSTDSESLQQLRDGIASGRIQVDADTEFPEDGAIDEVSGPVLVRDSDEQWEIGNNAINNSIEALRDDLRDKGMEDGPEMEAIVMAEREKLQDELARNIEGDFSDPYQKPDFSDLMQTEISAPAHDISDAEQTDETFESVEDISDVSRDIDYDAVYSGLDSYDFDGIDVGSDVERLDSSLESFQPETWEGLTADEQKAAMSDLADYVKDVIGFDKPPRIVYYNNPVDGDYGGYSPSTNTLEVNEHMLYDSDEAADTIAHELWHAYQHERALNPQSAKDFQYQYGFDNYIRPDVDFTAYQDQLVEAEARAFAQQFKDRLSTKRRSI